MSIEALMWALNLAPVPTTEKGSKPNPAAAAVLVGLANHAGPDGCNAFASAPTLMRYTRLSERAVWNALSRLAEAQIITPGDPAIVAAYIPRGDRQTGIWNLDMSLVRDDLSAAELRSVGRMNPFLDPLIRQALAAREGTNGPDGVQQVHPAVDNQPQRGAGDAPRGPSGVQQVHPVAVDNSERGAGGAPRDSERGAPGAGRGAGDAGRGAAGAPKEDLQEEVKPPPPPTSSASSPVDNQEDRRIEDVDHARLAALAEASLRKLPAPWRLDIVTRGRIADGMALRLGAGWQLAELAAELTHSPEGVRRPGGVLMARLKALPMAPPASAGPAEVTAEKCTEPGHQHYELPCAACRVAAKFGVAS